MPRSDMTIQFYRSLDMCPICFGPHIRFFSFGQENADLHRLLGTVVQRSSWWRCTDCNHVFLNPRFSDELESRLYGPESLYRVFSIGEMTIDEYLRTIDNTIGTQAVHAGHLKNLKDIIRRTGTSLGDNVLDFGAGFGAASSAFKKIGIQYLGYEFDDFCLEIARRLNRNVVRDVVENNRFSLVYSAQVFEHIGFPTQAMKRVSDFLEVDGYAYINVPTHQFGLFPPRNIGMGGVNCMNWGHVHSYTKESLTQLIEATGDLVVVDIWMRGFDVHCLAKKRAVQIRPSRKRARQRPFEVTRFRVAKGIFSPLHRGYLRFKEAIKSAIRG